jgi:ADP-heptose:LPS heptosyltransferase
MKKLILAPHIGENGWELFVWNPIARHIAKEYDYVICYGAENFKVLYEDFVDEFIPFEVDRTYACGMNNHLIVPGPPVEDLKYPTEVEKFLEKHKGEDIKRPWEENTTQEKDFIKFGNYDKELKYDIIFHMRNRLHESARNWPIENWKKLIELLKKDNYKMACVGSMRDFHVEGVDDLRHLTFKEELDVTKSSDLIVGSLSFGSQYAQLCSTKLLSWFYPNHRIGFQKEWNPFNNKCYYIGNVNPTPTEVYNEIYKIKKGIYSPSSIQGVKVIANLHDIHKIKRGPLWKP